MTLGLDPVAELLVVHARGRLLQRIKLRKLAAVFIGHIGHGVEVSASAYLIFDQIYIADLTLHQAGTVKVILGQIDLFIQLRHNIGNGAVAVQQQQNQFVVSVVDRIAHDEHHMPDTGDNLPGLLQVGIVGLQGVFHGAHTLAANVAAFHVSKIRHATGMVQVVTGMEAVTCALIVSALHAVEVGLIVHQLLCHIHLARSIGNLVFPNGQRTMIVDPFHDELLILVLFQVVKVRINTDSLRADAFGDLMVLAQHRLVKAIHKQLLALDREFGGTGLKPVAGTGEIGAERLIGNFKEEVVLLVIRQGLLQLLQLSFQFGMTGVGLFPLLILFPDCICLFLEDFQHTGALNDRAIEQERGTCQNQPSEDMQQPEGYGNDQRKYLGINEADTSHDQARNSSEHIPAMDLFLNFVLFDLIVAVEINLIQIAFQIEHLKGKLFHIEQCFLLVHVNPS